MAAAAQRLRGSSGGGGVGVGVGVEEALDAGEQSYAYVDVC
jgi:hypothetical protein